MTQLVGFGNGSDGILTVTTSTTDAPVDSTFSGTAAGSTGSGATGKTFAVGDLVLIHYSRGSAAGIWEVNQLSAYNSGTGAFGFVLPLANTYTDSGSDQCQIIRIPQYSSGNISAAGTITGKAWDGNVGGIYVAAFVARLTVDGNINVDNKGYIGGSGSGNCNCPSNPSTAGEGTAGAAVFGQLGANGNGGGGSNGNGMDGGPGGGGGENAGGATQGGNEQNGTGGSPGSVVGSADLTTMVFGGSGGGGRGEKNGNGNGGTGGTGAGIILLFVNELAGSGVISALGQNGNGASGSSSEGAGGGGAGAGGSIKVVCRTNSFNGTLRAYGGSGGGHSGTGPSGNGGTGGIGRIRIDCCSNPGTYSSNPGASVQAGGFSYCKVINQII